MKKKTSRLWKNRHLEEWFDLFNSRYFGGKLERPALLHFGYLPKDCLGHCGPLRHLRGPKPATPSWSITISSELRPSRRLAAGTLIHEMVHLEQKCRYSCGINGHHFNRRMKQIAAAGGFNGLW